MQSPRPEKAICALGAVSLAIWDTRFTCRGAPLFSCPTTHRWHGTRDPANRKTANARRMLFQKEIFTIATLSEKRCPRCERYSSRLCSFAPLNLGILLLSLPTRVRAWPMLREESSKWPWCKYRASYCSGFHRSCAQHVNTQMQSSTTCSFPYLFASKYTWTDHQIQPSLDIVTISSLDRWRQQHQPVV